jgi:catechol-2,3-dioxygenase
MGVIGIEEIFLKVKSMEATIEFYHGLLGIPLDKQDGEPTYLQAGRGHLVLQMENHTGRHQGGGPLHFAMTVEEDDFDEILAKFEGGRHFTRGPYGERGQGRALFMIDPDGNESSVKNSNGPGLP